MGFKSVEIGKVGRGVDSRGSVVCDRRVERSASYKRARLFLRARQDSTDWRETGFAEETSTGSTRTALRMVLVALVGVLRAYRAILHYTIGIGPVAFCPRVTCSRAR